MSGFAAAVSVTPSGLVLSKDGDMTDCEYFLVLEKSHSPIGQVEVQQPSVPDRYSPTTRLVCGSCERVLRQFRVPLEAVTYRQSISGESSGSWENRDSDSRRPNLSRSMSND